MAGKLVVGEIDDGNGVSQGTNPTGTIIMFYGELAPTGYLECNGQSTTGFGDLIAIVGANVPDLRGEFIRGWDNGRGVDTGRALGSTQDDAFQGHYHESDGYTNTTGSATVPFSGAGGVPNAIDRYAQTPVTDGTNGTPRTSSETRPRNVSLMYCIKT
jgi:phage-related tail fiber protein